MGTHTIALVHAHMTHYACTHHCTHVTALPIGHADYGRRPMRAQARYRMGTVIGHMTQYTHVMHTGRHGTMAQKAHFNNCTESCTQWGPSLANFNIAHMHAHTIAHA